MYQILILPHFKKQLKKLCKKYRHLKQDVIKSLSEFEREKNQFIRGSVYKIRIKSQDIPKGKSKSFRLIVFILEVKKIIIPVAIYFKGDKQSMSLKELNSNLQTILLEAKKEEMF